MYRGTHGRLEVAVAHSTLSSAPLESLWGLKPIGPSARAAYHREKACDDECFWTSNRYTFHPVSPVHTLCIRLSLSSTTLTTASNPHESLEEPHSNPPLVSYHEVRLFWDRRRQFFSPLQPLTTLFPLHESIDPLRWRLYKPSFNVSFHLQREEEREREWPNVKYRCCVAPLRRIVSFVSFRDARESYKEIYFGGLLSWWKIYTFFRLDRGFFDFFLMLFD